MVTLYHTTLSKASLQANLAAGASGSVRITNPGQPIIDLVLDNRSYSLLILATHPPPGAK